VENVENVGTEVIEADVDLLQEDTHQGDILQGDTHQEGIHVAHHEDVTRDLLLQDVLPNLLNVPEHPHQEKALVLPMELQIMQVHLRKERDQEALSLQMKIKNKRLTSKHPLH